MADKTLSPFPDILASKETKATDDYGLKYAKAIWGTHTLNILQYNTQRQRDIINRQYAEGLESVEKYKNLKGVPNTSYSNLDFSPVNIIATTVDNIVGRLSNTPYKIQCNAIDPESKSRFDDYRKELYADMFLKQYASDIEQRTGVPLIPKNKKIPDSDEEAEIHLKMNYKEDASIAMEEAFNYVFSSNMFDTSREAILRDLVVLKRAAIHRYYDEDWNIRVEREDVVDVITPYSKYDDFRNIPYIAVIKNYTIGEISVMHNYTDEQLFTIAQNNAGKNNNPAWNWSTSYEGYYNSTDYSSVRPYYNFNIQVLEFYFLGRDKETREYKTSQKRKYTNKVKEDYKTDNPRAEVISKSVQNLYQGKWIIGTDFIFNYKRAFNIPREKINGSYSPKATLPIKIIAPGIYDMQNKSPVERMIPHEDQINLANLAFQNFLIKAKPPGVAVDVRGLMDAAKGMGLDPKTGPLEITKIYEQTGNFIFSSITEENDVINSRVITELRGGVSDAFRSLIEVYQFKKQQIYEVIGINPYADPASAPTEVGLGVQDNAIQATNNALRPLFNAHLRLVETTFKEVALMIQDCIEFDNEAFINAIGTYATKTLEYGKKLAFVQMGIKIELLPDDKEKADIIGLITIGIDRGTLTASDAIRIKQEMKQDVKLASKLLVYLEEKNRKNKMAESAALQQQNGEIQIQSSQAAAQANAEAQIAINKSAAELLQLEYQLKSGLSAQEHNQIKEQLQIKNIGTATVAEINNDGKVDVQKAANDGKVVAQHVANVGKDLITEKSHNHKMTETAFENAIAPKKEKAEK